MDTQVCVNCLNKKPVNATSNRLVTETCGHVKCIDCLVNEKSGCVACAERSPEAAKPEDKPSDVPLSDSDAQTEFPLKHFIVPEVDSRESQTQYFYANKKKLEISHILIETDNNGRHYVCTICKKKFQARSQVLYHAYCNGQRKPYQCPECTKSFASHSHYKYHIRVHRNERTYACEICGDAFFQMSKLQRHKLKHTKEKKYSCTECNKAFNNLSALRKHGLTHSQERPYACEQCDRRFRDSSNYRKHVDKHNSACACGACGACGRRRAARAFQCPRCPQAFAARRDMRRHAAVHDDSKPFRCKVCSRRFRRKDNLERHARNTHPAPGAGARPQSPAPPGPLPADVEKSLILEANHARRSVIFGPVKREAARERSPEENEYVHKIRKANVMASCRRDVPLPPIDERKIVELEEKNHQNNLDVGAPPAKFRELYKKILYERSEKEAALAAEEEKQHASPEMHWRRKMKLNINCNKEGFKEVKGVTKGGMGCFSSCNVIELRADTVPTAITMRTAK